MVPIYCTFCYYKNILKIFLKIFDVFSVSYLLSKYYGFKGTQVDMAHGKFP